jgi:hypothetical protein
MSETAGVLTSRIARTIIAVALVVVLGFALFAREKADANNDVIDLIHSRLRPSPTQEELNAFLDENAREYRVVRRLTREAMNGSIYEATFDGNCVPAVPCDVHLWFFLESNNFFQVYRYEPFTQSR